MKLLARKKAFERDCKGLRAGHFDLSWKVFSRVLFLVRYDKECANVINKMAIKSGWLFKYSDSLFSDWKKRYCVLYEDGRFSIFRKPGHTALDQSLIMRTDCKQIVTGYECHKWKAIHFPKGTLELESLFSLKTRQRHLTNEIIFAAKTPNECDEWVEVLLAAQGEVTVSDVFASMVNDKGRKRTIQGLLQEKVNWNVGPTSGIFPQNIFYQFCLADFKGM